MKEQTDGQMDKQTGTAERTDERNGTEEQNERRKEERREARGQIREIGGEITISQSHYFKLILKLPSLSLWFLFYHGSRHKNLRRVLCLLEI